MIRITRNFNSEIIKCQAHAINVSTESVIYYNFDCTVSFKNSFSSTEQFENFIIRLFKEKAKNDDSVLFEELVTEKCYNPVKINNSYLDDDDDWV